MDIGISISQYSFLPIIIYSVPACSSGSGSNGASDTGVPRLARFGIALSLILKQGWEIVQ